MTSTKSQDWLSVLRTVRFGDTDGAGVIHFHHLLRWCHESWEESLDGYGLKATDIFPSIPNRKHYVPVALPIVHCEADFFSPIRIGDQLGVCLIPRKLSFSSFDVQYKFHRGETQVAVAIIRHFAINSETRQSCELPEGIKRWLEASTLNNVISSL